MNLRFSLADAVQFYSVRGLGKTFLKKMSLKEAVGDLGDDKRLKSNGNEKSKPTGILAAKARKGYRTKKPPFPEVCPAKPQGLCRGKHPVRH